MPKGLAPMAFMAALLVGATAAFAAPPAAMTADRIRMAIAWGEAAPETELQQYTIRAERSWVVNFDTPFLRVAQLARARKILNQPIGEEDVAAPIAAPELHVYAHARFDESLPRTAQLPNVEYVAILRPTPGGPTETILPRPLQSFLRRIASPAEGRPRIARGVKAVFPLDALAAGNSVRIIFQDGTLLTVPLPAEVMARAR